MSRIGGAVVDKNTVSCDTSLIMREITRVPSLSVYMLQFDGERNHEGLGDAFLQAARELARSGKEYAHQEGDHYVLEIRTKYVYRSIHFIFGIEFSATFECNHGKSTATFIVPSHAIDNDRLLAGTVTDPFEIIPCNLN